MKNPFFISWTRYRRKYIEVKEEEKPFTSSSPDGSTADPSEIDVSLSEFSQLRRRVKILFAFSITLATLLLCLTSLCIRVTISKPVRQPVHRHHCGRTVAEAKSLGCTFDLLSRSWLPKDCSRFGGEEFIQGLRGFPGNHTGWGIYRDRQQTYELTMEEIGEYAESGLKWYGTERQHLLHCAWTLKRVLNAYLNGKKVDGVTKEFVHTGHCVDTLHGSTIREGDLDRISLSGNVRFGIC